MQQGGRERPLHADQQVDHEVARSGPGEDGRGQREHRDPHAEVRRGGDPRPTGPPADQARAEQRPGGRDPEAQGGQHAVGGGALGGAAGEVGDDPRRQQLDAAQQHAQDQRDSDQAAQHRRGPGQPQSLARLWRRSARRARRRGRGAALSEVGAGGATASQGPRTRGSARSRRGRAPRWRSTPCPRPARTSAPGSRRRRARRGRGPASPRPARRPGPGRSAARGRGRARPRRTRSPAVPTTARAPAPGSPARARAGRVGRRTPRAASPAAEATAAATTTPRCPITSARPPVGSSSRKATRL